MNWQTVYDYAK